LHQATRTWNLSFTHFLKRTALQTTAALAIAILLPNLAPAQKISAGIVAGASLTDGFRDEIIPNFVPPGSPSFPVGTRFWSPSKDFVAGGMVELHFNPTWSLEVNGLYRLLHGKWAAVLPDGELHSISPHPVVTWQFPILAKYRLQGERWTPFLEAGPSFRTAGNLNSSDPSHYGFTAGAGIDLQWKKLRIAPTVRYTRWAKDNNVGGAEIASNQVEILVGLSGQSEVGGRPLGRHISLGFQVGTNLRGDYRTENLAHEGNPPIIRSSGPRVLIYGPSLEVHLPHRLSVEVNALQRPFRSATETTFDGTIYRTTYAPVTWVFPILAKYRISQGALSPFVAAGPAFRLRQTLAAAEDASPYGIATAAGIETQFGPLRIAPAIRFTYWAPNRRDFGGPIRNQLDFLVGFAF
jgi:hypothetical protein